MVERNATCSKALAQEGCYGDVMQALGSSGCAEHDNEDTLKDLRHRHPKYTLPDWSDDIPAPLSVAPTAVISALGAFPCSTSPGCFRLRAQHLLDAVDGCTAPSSTGCFE